LEKIEHSKRKKLVKANDKETDSSCCKLGMKPIKLATLAKE